MRLDRADRPDPLDLLFEMEMDRVRKAVAARVLIDAYEADIRRLRLDALWLEIELDRRRAA